MSVFTCVEAREQPLVSSLRHRPHCWVFSWLFNLWDKIFPWHRAHQADKADWPVSPCILPDSTSAILGLHHMLPIPSRSRESNSDSHDYKVSTLTLLSPLPSSWSSFNQHNFRVMEFSCCASVGQHELQITLENYTFVHLGTREIESSRKKKNKKKTLHSPPHKLILESQSLHPIIWTMPSIRTHTCAHACTHTQSHMSQRSPVQ